MTRYCLFIFLFLGLSKIAFAQLGEGNPDRKVRFSPLPVISYTPETRLGFGALVGANFKLSPDSVTRGSYMQTSFIYTVNKQYEWSNKGRIYGPQNKSITEYKVYYAYFPEFFFGYQTENPDSYKELIQYNRLLFEGRRFWRVQGHSYIGLFARYNKIYNLKTVPGGSFESAQPPGATGYQAVGIAPAFNYDSRDSQVYPKQGRYLEVLWMAYPGRINDHVFGNFRLDARAYKAPGKLKDDVLAFQVFVNLNQGNVPYKEMAEIGGSTTMRGYYSGYYRYKNLYAMQTEYRFILKKYVGFAGWLGMSVTSEDWLKPFSHPIRPNGGVGLRLRINQHDKLSIRADYGIGYHQTGFYLNIAEAF